MFYSPPPPLSLSRVQKWQSVIYYLPPYLYVGRYLTVPNVEGGEGSVSQLPPRVNNLLSQHNRQVAQVFSTKERGGGGGILILITIRDELLLLR